MKKVRKMLSAFLPPLQVFGLAVGVLSSALVFNEAGRDTAIYSKEASVTEYAHPAFSSDDEDEDEDVTVQVDKVILHYYNEGGGNEERAFYLWVTGVDGVEFNTKFGDTYNPGGVMVIDDTTLMTITIDFSNPTFAEFGGRSGLYFIIKYALKSETDLNWGGQSDDMFIRYADYPNAINGDNVCELWTMPAAGGGIAILDSEAKTKVHGVALAQFTDWKTIHCTLTSNTKSVNWKLYAYDQTYFKIKPKKRAEYQKWYLVKESSGTGDFDISLKYEAHINVVYSLESHDPSTDSDPDMAALSKVVTVGFDKLYDSEKFHTYYEHANENVQLGATYTSEGTTFRVWSPVSANMNLLVYEKDTSSEYCGSTDEATKKAYDKYQAYHMQYKSGGIWEVTVKGDLEGKYYNYQVDNTLGTNVCMDPYATSAGANGLRGLIYDKNGAKVTPTGWNELKNKWGSGAYDISSPQELTVYEVHIQDFTADASWNGTEKPGTYKAFVEKGTRLQGETGDDFWKMTGYDHLNGLGVNAVQIMPTFDHDNNEVATPLKYNWGYNPLNYNVPEGAYSSDPHDGYARVKEFKEMVLGMSETDAHTRVIMDVVYNHVSSATGSCFHKLMPRYYFRYAMKDYTYYWQEDGVTKSSTVKQGELWDGSGCHNEVASERPMMRKFIVDSLCMWAKDYQIKGFRFDLMGLIDFQTMIAAKKALYQIDPDIYLYGEGWTSGGYHGEGSSEYNEYYGGTPHNYGAFTWQVYNECNNFRNGTITDEIYLGGFNDTFRNAVKGSNDGGGGGYPGEGWVQRGNYVGTEFKDDFLSAVATGLWGLNIGVHGNGQQGNNDNTGRFPEQTVNYVSCHDNWTVRDQLFQTLLNKGADPNSIGDRVLRASIQSHAITFASNGVAFILGGEELLRTKTVKDAAGSYDYTANVADKDSYRAMYGNIISHNSYNSPIEVNSFKWGNKKEVTFVGEKDSVPFTSTVQNSVYNYCDAFKTIIRMHNYDVGNNKRTFKRGENVGSIEELGFPWANYWWSKTDQDMTQASNCVAINLFNERTVLLFVGPGLGEAGNYLKNGVDLRDDSRRIFQYGDWYKDSNHYGPDGSQGAWNAVLIGRP